MPLRTRALRPSTLHSSWLHRELCKSLLGILWVSLLGLISELSVVAQQSWVPHAAEPAIPTVSSDAHLFGLTRAVVMQNDLPGSFQQLLDAPSLLTPLFCNVVGAEPELFGDSARVMEIHLELSFSAVEQLRSQPRRDVTASVRSGTNLWKQVAVHIKGRIGSRRTIDEKPSWTLDFSKQPKDQRFHGETKVHLNNSVEDPSFLNEFLGVHLFRKAGIPAPAAGHVLVFLNERRLGLYVMKESFSPSFLSKAFPGEQRGILYEPEQGHDVDESLLQKSLKAKARSEPSPLKLLAQALKDPDLSSRVQRVRPLLDVDRFVRFMAMEVMIGHRDGYCLAKNNFRLFFDANTRRFTFLPHGMDVLFGTPELVWQPDMAGLVSRSLMQTDEIKAAYRRELVRAVEQGLDIRSIKLLLDRRAAHLAGVLSASEAVEMQSAVGSLEVRIEQRRLSLLSQLSSETSRVLDFAKRFEPLTHWLPRDVPEGGVIKQDRLEGRQALMIQAGPRTSASWRTRVRLRSGHYQFEADVQSSDLKPLGFGNHQGVLLRRAGSEEVSESMTVASHAWKPLQLKFHVDSEGEVELICELRASGGRAWFASDSLRLTRLESHPPADPERVGKPQLNIKPTVIGDP